MSRLRRVALGPYGALHVYVACIRVTGNPIDAVMFGR